MTHYVATDEDLPEIFFRQTRESSPLHAIATERDLGTRSVAVLMHYPEIRVTRGQQRRRNAANRAEKELQLGDKKVFVKLSKKCQMWDWLRALFAGDILSQIRVEQNDNVMQFLTQLYAKFYRYSPYKCKWITRKQYDWLKYIACQYLKVPE